MKLWETARIRYRLGATGYKRLHFIWFYDWNEDWDAKSLKYYASMEAKQ